MKYTASNPPFKCYMTQSRWYQRAAKAKTLGVCWHSTGANNTAIARYVQPDDNASNYAEMISIIGNNRYKNDWNHLPNLAAGVHCFVGKLADGTVSTVNVGPWDNESWGVGTGTTGYSLNQGWIQFEICEDNLKDKAYFDAVYNEAVELTAYLCKTFNLDPHGTVLFHGVKVPVITCHADSYTLGFGSGHADVLHWFKLYGKTMQNVRDDVSALIKAADKPAASASPAPSVTSPDPAISKPSPAPEASSWSAEARSWAIQKGLFSGDGNGNYDWLGNVTREQLAVLLYKFAQLK